jgi:hypothetical protein
MTQPHTGCGIFSVLTVPPRCSIATSGPLTTLVPTVRSQPQREVLKTNIALKLTASHRASRATRNIAESPDPSHKDREPIPDRHQLKARRKEHRCQVEPAQTLGFVHQIVSFLP